MMRVNFDPSRTKKIHEELCEFAVVLKASYEQTKTSVKNFVDLMDSAELAALLKDDTHIEAPQNSEMSRAR